MKRKRRHVVDILNGQQQSWMWLLPYGYWRMDRAPLLYSSWENLSLFRHLSNSSEPTRAGVRDGESVKDEMKDIFNLSWKTDQPRWNKKNLCETSEESLKSLFTTKSYAVCNQACVDLRIRGFHLTVGSGITSFSNPRALEGNFSVILTEDWR